MLWIVQRLIAERGVANANIEVCRWDYHILERSIDVRRRWIKLTGDCCGSRIDLYGRDLALRANCIWHQTDEVTNPTGRLEYSAARKTQSLQPSIDALYDSS